MSMSVSFPFFCRSGAIASSPSGDQISWVNEPWKKESCADKHVEDDEARSLLQACFLRERPAWPPGLGKVTLRNAPLTPCTWWQEAPLYQLHAKLPALLTATPPSLSAWQTPLGLHSPPPQRPCYTLYRRSSNTVISFNVVSLKCWWDAIGT